MRDRMGEKKYIGQYETSVPFKHSEVLYAKLKISREMDPEVFRADFSLSIPSVPDHDKGSRYETLVSVRLSTYYGVEGIISKLKKAEDGFEELLSQENEDWKGKRNVLRCILALEDAVLKDREKYT